MIRFISYIVIAIDLLFFCTNSFASTCDIKGGITHFENLINTTTRYAPQMDVLSLAINNPKSLPDFEHLILNGNRNIYCALMYLDNTYSDRMNNEILAKRRVAIASTKDLSPSDMAIFINGSVNLRINRRITEPELIDIAFNPLLGHPRKNYKDRDLIAAWLRVKSVISENMRIKDDIDLVISGGIAREVPPT